MERPISFKGWPEGERLPNPLVISIPRAVLRGAAVGKLEFNTSRAAACLEDRENQQHGALIISREGLAALGPR